MGDKHIMHLFLHSLTDFPRELEITFNTGTGFQFNLIYTQSKNYELTTASVLKADAHSHRSSIILVVHDK